MMTTHPMMDQLDLFHATNGSVRRLSHLRRYSSFRAMWPENVAEHSFYVAHTAFLIATDVNLNRPGLPQIDRGAVLEHAIMHDCEEALTGDVITIFKNSHPELKHWCKTMAHACAEALFNEYGAGVGSEVKQAWAAGGDAKAIVDFADLICVATYARDEYIAGNKAFVPVLRDIHRDMRRFRDDSLFGKYIEQFWPNDHWADVAREVHAVNSADLYPKVNA